MKINQRMIDTNRLVFKNFNNEKVVVERRNIGDNAFMYFVFFDDRKVESIYRDSYKLQNELEKIYSRNKTEQNSLYTLTELYLDSDSVVLSMEKSTNCVLRNTYFVDYEGFVHEINTIHIPEPEEDIINSECAIAFDNLKEIITDPVMFEEMYKEKIISADHDVLRKYDVDVPEFVSIKGGNSHKTKIKTQKHNLTIAKK